MNNTLIDTYIEKSTWRIKENSNQIFCVGHLMNFLSGSLIHDYWLNNVMTEKIKEFHDSGKIHLHDLSRITPYCSGFSTNEIITKGLKGPKGRIASNPPKHLASAINQLTNFVGVMSQEFAGAIALNDFSLYLAPFVFYDKLDYKQVKQEIQQFIFHMNQPNRWAGECPFTNITINLAVPADMADIPVFAGKFRERTYGEFEKEMNMINEAILEVLIEGDANGTPMTFPVLTIGINGNFPWDSEIAKKVFQVTAKYGTPFFENFGKDTGRDPSDTRSMCPLQTNTRVMIKDRTNIKSIEIGKLGDYTKQYEVLSEGEFKKGTFIKVPTKHIIEITLSNNQILRTTPEHLNYTKRGILSSKDLNTNDYLPYSLLGYGEENEKSKDIGYLIGCYIGDGSKTENSVTFSLSENKLNCVHKIYDILKNNLGLNPKIRQYKNEQLISIVVSSNGLSQYIDDFIKGNSALNKEMTYKVFTANKTFREYLLKGWYATDGGNSNRIYTKSKKLKNNFIDICGSIGTVGNIIEDNRKLKKEHLLPGQKTQNALPTYVLRFYNQHTLKHKSYGDIYKQDEESDDITWFKIKNIKTILAKGGEKGYCFQMEDDPIFTLSNGLLTHNCRLSLSTKDLVKHTGGLFGSADSTGSLAVATINLNRIGYEAKTEEEYYNKIEEAMIVCKDALELRRTKINEMYDKNLYVYTKFYLKNYKSYFSTIGIIGGNESMLNFMGKDIDDPEARAFMLNVLSFMRGKCEEFSAETKNLYNLEAIPGEGSMYSLARKDLKAYPDIILSGKDEKYLTGSTLPPVEQDDFVKLITNQEDLQVGYTGGTALNIYIGEKLSSYLQAKTIVKKIIENTKIPYFSITPTYSICKEHGYIAGEKYNCPECNKVCEVFSRVVGYLKPKNQMNPGKVEEFKRRKYFDIKDTDKLQKVKTDE